MLCRSSHRPPDCDPAIGGFMPFKKYAATFAISTFLISAPSYLFSQQDERDRAKSAPTADQAGNKMSDRDIMQKIRKSVVDDKSISTYGHNVKIIARNGKVTLKGPVRSEEEKRSIERKAGEVCGPENVTNEISIRPEHNK